MAENRPLDRGYILGAMPPTPLRLFPNLDTPVDYTALAYKTLYRATSQPFPLHTRPPEMFGQKMREKFFSTLGGYISLTRAKFNNPRLQRLRIFCPV